MKINKVEINNFYSIKKSSFNFNKTKGIVLIEGNNKDTGGSNGAGKSVLIESVVWGLFGRTIRKSTEEALVNKYTKKECSVKITVNDNVVIERGKRPTFLRVFIDGKEATRDNALNTQRFIEEYLNTNYKVFLASTVFGQQNNVEFISCTPDDKRSIIKNFLNLDELFSLRDSVKFLKSEYSQQIKRQSVIIEENEKIIKSFNKKIENLNSLKKEAEKLYDKKVLSLSLDEILKIEADNASIDWQVSKINRELEQIEKSIDSLNKKIRNPVDEYVCNSCGQMVKKANHPKHLAMQLRELDDKKVQYIKNKESAVKGRKTAPISSHQYHKITEYHNLIKECSTFTELKEETKEKIQEAHNQKQEYNNLYEIMRFWEKAFSESGLVRYIIRNVLELFNSKTNFYLSHLTKGKFSIEFDEELNETIKTNGKDINYISLSGGEKRKVGIAVMLGLQQLLTISQKEEINLMFFDEVAENLDQDGLDGLYILLTELKKDKSLFVITHNNYLKSLMDNSRTLSIIKNKGITNIVGF
jgi:DNA repair exonuclease SbcCD ATPase subunit